VAERRRAYGLTQEQLAEKLDVSLKYLQRVEAGEENLTLLRWASRPTPRRRTRWRKR
jgi:transcriptional regulator with XRE-family HTH domain